MAAALALGGMMLLTPVASAHPSASANWQSGFAGTGTLFGLGFGFWGWCQFFGSTSGSNADCSISQYLHNGSSSVQCETNFVITSWVLGPGGFTGLTGQPEFIVTGGSIAVQPAAQTWACAAFLAPAGFNVTVVAPGMLAIAGPSDSGVPASAGHYAFNGLNFGPISFTELQIQVSGAP
jgi:hypothetical protein